MIVPMKKVSLITMGDKKNETLKKLRRLGIMHIEMAQGTSERINELKSQIALLEGAVFSAGEKKNPNAKIQKSADLDVFDLSREIVDLTESKKSWIAEKNALAAELERIKKWGDFAPSQIKELAEKGIGLSLYEMPRTEYGLLGNGIKTIKVAKSGSSILFLAVEADEDKDEKLFESISSYRVKLPELSPAEIKARISQLDLNINSADEKISSYAVYIDSMKAAVKKCENEIEFETYATGMEEEKLSGEGRDTVSVSYFKGYIEADELDKLKRAAKDNSWGLLIEEPTEEDDVPTKLKNNKFVSLIYPLIDFLGTVPGYFEYDISGWFLSFILIFFGIIFGDGGYGLFICAVAAIPILRSLLKKKKPQPVFLLIGLFGLSTVIWGTLTCTWFGLSPENLPSWLKSLSVPYISNVYADRLWYPFWTNGVNGLTTAQNLQIFCFTLALIQLTVAHVKGAVRNRRSLKMLGDVGSILQLVGIFYIVLSFVVNAKVFSFGLVIGGLPIGTLSIAFVGMGFALSFIFSNYEGSVIKSLLTSLTNIVSVLLGVVNVFSDIVSYIRLWAVGLAGAAISATVNELAGPLFGNFLFMILAIFLLVFGHGLNMILNILSVIVHGIRLNTLEFSSHLDMSWSGHKFKPFEEHIDNKGE